MLDLNLGREKEHSGKVRAKLRSLLQTKDTNTKVSVVKKDVDYARRILEMPSPRDR